MYYFRTIILFYYKVNELCLPGCEIRVFLLLYKLPVRITDYSSFSFVLVPVNPIYLRFNGDWNLDGNSDINLRGENLECVNCIRNLFPYQLCCWMSCGL